MAKASDNLFPYVHLVPAAAPAAPAAGAERLYLDSADGKLKRKNSAGTVTTVEGGGGGTGETTWTAPTFIGTWVNFGAPYANAGFRKDGQGLVHLRGLVKSGAAGTNIFILPVGYRPPFDILAVTNSSANPSNIIVRANGEVVHNNGGTAHFSLDIPPFYTD